MALPTGKQESNFKAIEPGNYEARLKGMTLQVNTEYESQKFNDGDGLAYQACTLIWDVDGDEFRDAFIRVSMTDNSKLYNRFSALLGRDLTETDVIEWKVAKEAVTNYALDQYYKASKDDPEKGVKRGQYVLTGDPVYEGIEGAVEDVLINGESLFGRSCLLQIGKNERGYNTATAKAAAPLPKRTGRRAPHQAAEDRDAGGEQEDAAPTSTPRRRRQPPAGAPT